MEREAFHAQTDLSANCRRIVDSDTTNKALRASMRRTLHVCSHIYTHSPRTHPLLQPGRVLATHRYCQMGAKKEATSTSALHPRIIAKSAGNYHHPWDSDTSDRPEHSHSPGGGPPLLGAASGRGLSSSAVGSLS